MLAFLWMVVFLSSLTLHTTQHPDRPIFGSVSSSSTAWFLDGEGVFVLLVERGDGGKQAARDGTVIVTP